MYKVSIILLNWNNEAFTIECIQSLRKLKTVNIKVSIVVVDNHSSSQSLKAIEKISKPLTILRNYHNLGWTGGNNTGIRFALQHGADAILLLNNDTVVDPKSLTELLKALYSQKNIGIVGPKIYFYKNPLSAHIIADAGGTMKKHRYFGVNRGHLEKEKGQFSKNETVDFIAGSAMLIKKEVFEKVGLINEELFMYYDDVDLCFRAKNAGFISMFVPSAIIYHRVSATISPSSPFFHYYTTRNHYMFVEKHAPILEKLREWFRTPKTAYEFWKSSDQTIKKYSLLGIRDYYLRKFGKRKYW